MPNSDVYHKGEYIGDIAGITQKTHRDYHENDNWQQHENPQHVRAGKLE